MPDDDRSLEALAEGLQGLRQTSGLTFRELGNKAHYSAAILQRATSGRRLPSWPVVRVFVEVCGGDLERFEHLWETAARSWEGAADTEEPSPPPTDLDLMSEPPQPAQSPSQSAQSPPQPAQSPEPSGGSPHPEPPTIPGAAVSATPVTETPRWWRRFGLVRLIAVGAVVAVLAAVVLVAVLLRPGPCDTDTTQAAPTGECIGVSTGSFVFAGDLAGISGLIAAENKAVDDRVAARPGTQAVSVAFLVPLPTPGNTTASSLATALRHELQGAYIAQLRANHTQEIGATPLIRLLIANAGQGNAQWVPVVDRLTAMAKPDAPEHLVGVVGFGQSLATTKAAIATLNRARIPTIASRLTADDLSGNPGDPVNGFARVAPTNSDEAKAAADYLRRTTSRVLIIQDGNANDLYAATLGHEFASRYPTDLSHTLIQPVETYDSSLPAVANAFYQLTPTICQKKPDTIYFAGRGVDLSALMSALASRSCPEVPINVFTGDDSGDLATALQTQLAAGTTELQQALQQNLTLRYTSLANPGAWATDPTHMAFSGTSYFTDRCPQCFASLFPTDHLDDDAAIMGHDAVLAAAVAIRGLVDQRNPALPADAAGALVQQLYRLHDAQAVPGASGRISLNNRGDPIAKPIPIVELKPTGTVAFVELATGQ